MVANPPSRTPRRSPPPTTLALAAVALVALPGVAAAQDDGLWAIHVFGLYFSPKGDAVAVDRGVERTTHTVAESGAGFGLDVERRLTRRISVEAGAFFVDLDQDFRLESAGGVLSDQERMSIYTFYVGADWHLTPGARADLHVGAFLAQVNYEDVVFLTEAGRREILRFDDDYGPGVKLGVEWPFRDDGPWILRADLRYLVALLESEVAGEDVDLDPWMATVGVALRF